MTAPKITRIEIHEYQYSLEDMGKDYNGFNLVYSPGSVVNGRGHIIRILTDDGLAGEYAGGRDVEYASLPSVQSYGFNVNIKF